jgi:hypothetical protein
MLHWLIVVTILGYFWFLITRVARPKPPKDPQKSSNAIPWIKIAASWILVLVLGTFTLSLVVTMPGHHAGPGDTSGQITDLVFALAMPFLFALSVRWVRTLSAQRTN